MKILNFGSLNLDFTYQVNRIALPGETISSHSFSANLGGKGLNQSVALAKAGAEVYHAGKIGNDGFALRDYLRENKVNTKFVHECESCTGHAVIQVDDSGQNSIIIYGGANITMDDDFISSVIREFNAGDIILLQNEINALDKIMEQAHRIGMHIAFNPSPCSADITKLPLHYVKWFFINEIEGRELTSQQSPEEIASKMLRLYPDCSVILTLGEKGALYCDKAYTCTQNAFNVRAVDTTAAGDTFTGYFLAGLLNNRAIPDILKSASAASALTVSSKGAAESIPDLQKVLEFLDANNKLFDIFSLL